jgi:cytochrome c
MTNGNSIARIAGRAIHFTTLAVLMALATPGAPSHAAGAEELIEKDGCAACHRTDEKLIGPSFKAIAAKYRAQPDAAARLFDVVRNGTDEPSWGEVPMPQNPPGKVPDEELKRLLDFILSL